MTFNRRFHNPAVCLIAICGLVFIFFVLQVLLVERRLDGQPKQVTGPEMAGAPDSTDATGAGGGANTRTKKKAKRSGGPTLKDIGRKAGGVKDISPKTLSDLPPLEEAEVLYGTKPIVWGLSSCDAFRDEVNVEDRIVAPTGLFHSGTNLAHQLLSTNCGGGAKRVRSEVPWGEHSPAAWRETYINATTARGGDAVESSMSVARRVLPIVVIKDPFTWMSSMCRFHSHEQHSSEGSLSPDSPFEWYHEQRHCPNIYPMTPLEMLLSSKWDGEMPVTVRYTAVHPDSAKKDASNNNTAVTYSSLVGLWNAWYTSWGKMDFPFLLVRFEDFLFHAETVVDQICRCAGMDGTKDSFRYYPPDDEDASDMAAPLATTKTREDYATPQELATALGRYGNASRRLEGHWDVDIRAAERTLSQPMMEYFHYLRATLGPRFQ